MSITLLGVATVLALVAAWVLWRPAVGAVLAACLPFPQTAGIIFGGRGFPLFYTAIALVLVLSAPALLAHAAGAGRGTFRQWSRPDAIVLTLWTWCVFVTLTGPRLFSGIAVFDPRLGIDGQVGRMARLAFSTGNLSQLAYLTLGTGLVLVAGRTVPLSRRTAELGLALTLLLALLRLALGGAWPTTLLQNMPGNSYASFDPRLSGTLSEPSMLGLYLVAAGAYFASRLAAPRRADQVLAVLALAVVAVEIGLNRSGTAITGATITAALALLVAVVRIARNGRATVRPAFVAATVALLALALSQLRLLEEVVVGTVLGKSDSVSLSSRSASNVRSIQIFLETRGYGVGLGSHRPSSLFFMLLACVGVVGVVLVAALVASLLRPAPRGSAEASASWALLGTLAAAAVSVPDLSLPVLWLLLALGASAARHSPVPIPLPVPLEERT